MSGRIVAILLCVLGLLFGAVYLTKPKAPGTAEAGPVTRLVDAPPSLIGQIEVREQTGEFVRVGKRDRWAGWLVEWGIGDIADGAWPAAETTRVSGARVLSTSMVQSGPEADLTDASSVLILSTEGEVLQSLDMGRTPLAGLLPVRLAGSNEWMAIGREIGDFLKGEALLMWRDHSVFPGLDASATGISLGHNDEVKLRLRRVGNAWSLDYPVKATAEPEAVQSLLEGLVGLRSQQFTSERVGADMLTVTAELPSQGESGSNRYTMLLDSESSVCDVMLFADVDGRVTEIARAGMELNSADAGFLTEIEATDFIGKVALDVPASEIVGFTTSNPFTGEIGFTERRTPDGWAVLKHGHSDNWLSLFTERPADQIQLEPPGVPVHSAVEFTRFGGLSLGTFELAFESGTLYYWIGQGGVWRGYDGRREEIKIGI